MPHRETTHTKRISGVSVLGKNPSNKGHFKKQKRENPQGQRYSRDESRPRYGGTGRRAAELPQYQGAAR